MGPNALGDGIASALTREGRSVARYVIYGAGAIGGVIGARLHAAGHQVALLARGAHFEAIARHGLLLERPGGSDRFKIEVAEHPSRLAIAPEDTVIIATKSQDTAGALVELSRAAGSDVAVACAQNGVENERAALRRFPNVYGCLVIMPATHLRPGVVAQPSAPVAGVLDVGRVGSGRDGRVVALAEDLRGAGFASEVSDDILAWKRRKLLSNLANAPNALFGKEEAIERYVQRAREEGRACFAAAHLEVVAEASFEQRSAILREQTTDDRLRSGSSSWQSLARGAGTIEADYLNGEIALLGRLHHVPTPVNAALQRLANEHAARHSSPGSVPLAELEELL